MARQGPAAQKETAMHIVRKSDPVNDGLFDAALGYHARRWSIIPTVEKKSAHHWKQFQAGPADDVTLRRMFLRKDITGIAVIQGSASGGLVCRDFDVAEAYHRWAAAHPDLAKYLPTVQTARGFHVYFVGPEFFKKLADGEYRGTCRQYTLVPPSKHPAGADYAWLVPLPDGDLPIVEPAGAGLLEHAPDVQDAQAFNHSSHNTHLCERGKILIAIAETLPTRFGQRRRKLFDFARSLKSIIPAAGSSELKPIVREWFTAALPFIRTKEWSVTWEDFVAALESVRHATRGKWDELVLASRSSKLDTGDHDGAVAAILRLAAVLQQHHGDGVPFPLSCRKAGEAAGISHERAARVLKMLVFEGSLELVSPAGIKGSRVAATFRFGATDER